MTLTSIATKGNLLVTLTLVAIKGVPLVTLRSIATKGNLLATLTLSARGHPLMILDMMAKREVVLMTFWCRELKYIDDFSLNAKRGSLFLTFKVQREESYI